MSLWQPRSVLQLILVGFFAALLPLGVAILFTVHTMGEVATKNREGTLIVVEVTRLGQEIQRDLLEIDRRVRQYLALGNDDLARLFERERDILLVKLETLRDRIPSSNPDINSLMQALKMLSLASDSHMEPTTETALTPSRHLDKPLRIINEKRLAVEQWLQTSVDQILARNAKQAESNIAALTQLLWLLALVTLALLLLFAYWISKPVKELTQEIHQLGTKGLSHSIEISGPQEVQALGRKLEWLRRQLHETEQQKQQFLRHISHELKTPLSSLREGADLLAEQITGHLSQQQQEIVEIVRQNGIELQRLIENLIDYNQVPRQELTIEKFDLEPLWQEILSNYTISIERKHLRVIVRGEVDSWTADRYKLKTTLDNLLSNAVNYTAEYGNIDVVWRVEDANLVIEVANSGEPIPLEDQTRVFEPFFQSTARRAGPIKGSGIGLSVARECIEAQNGSLILIPHDQFATCFRLICPAH